MSKAKWKLRADAPKDGTPIIALYADCSGVCAVRWSFGEPYPEGGWYEFDPNEKLGIGSDASQDFAGWIEFPAWEIVQSLRQKKPSP